LLVRSFIYFAQRVPLLPFPYFARQIDQEGSFGDLQRRRRRLSPHDYHHKISHTFLEVAIAEATIASRSPCTISIAACSFECAMSCLQHPLETDN